MANTKTVNKPVRKVSVTEMAKIKTEDLRKLASFFAAKDPTDIPEKLKKKLDREGLEARWLNAPRLAKTSNFHKNGYEIYRADSDEKYDGYSQGADGTIRSGDLVLGVRRVEIGNAHRANLEVQNRILKQAVSKPGKAFKEEARQHGLNIRDQDVEDLTEVGRE